MKKLFHYLRPYALFAAISPLMMMAEVLADLCLPFLMSFIVDFGIEADGLAAIRETGGFPLWAMQLLHGEDFTQLQIILTFGIMMLCVTLVGGLFGVGCAYTAARAAQSFGNDLRRDAYARVMSLSIEQTDRFTTGSLVTRMTNDISMIVDFIEHLLRMFVRAPMFLIGGTVMLLLLEVRFGVVLALSVPILLVTLIIVLARAIPMYGIMQKKLDRVNSVVQENVSGARVVKAYVCEEHEYERFEEANRELCGVNYRVLRLMAITTPMLNILMNASVIALIWIGGVQINTGDLGMTTGTVMAGITYVTQVINSIMMVTMMFQSVSRALASAKRVSEVMDTEPVIKGGSDTHLAPTPPLPLPSAMFPSVIPPPRAAPCWRASTLTFVAARPLPSLVQPAAERPRWVNLIPRFYDATEGEILIDGAPIRSYKLGELRRRIGYVMQKSRLFSDTVENNLRWGDPDATHEEIVEAATVAQADGFVRSFAEGYNTPVAEKGASLSGGQKQRLCIARALVRKPEILILDDATSALDLATEARLQAAMRKTLTNTTVIMIAQRIVSVKNADRIAVLENGMVTDVGTHDELMQRSETYRDIYHSQTRESDREEVAAHE